MKPIKLTDAQVRQIQEDIQKMLADEKFYNGKIDLRYTLESVQRNVKLGFDPMAFAKMQALIYSFDSEVAWHGQAVRTESGFYIKDIMVYPQEVSGTTVNTDQDGYERWLMGLEDDVFNECRMQGHSHVNMGTSPSSVDTTHQEAILEQLEDADYYIFMIWNKRMESTIYIFDMENNAMYENSDISIYIGDEDFDMAGFLRDAKDSVKTKTYTTNYKTSKSSGKDNKTKTSKKTWSYYDDEDVWMGSDYFHRT